MDFAALKAAIAAGMRFGAHALQALLDDNLDMHEVRASVLANGDMIEDYPNDPRGRVAWCSACFLMARRCIQRGDGAALVLPS